MKLVLNKEALTELTTDELTHVFGGAPLTPSCPLVQNLHDRLSDLGTCG